MLALSYFEALGEIHIATVFYREVSDLPVTSAPWPFVAVVTPADAAISTSFPLTTNLAACGVKDLCPAAFVQQFPEQSSFDFAG